MLKRILASRHLATATLAAMTDEQLQERYLRSQKIAARSLFWAHVTMVTMLVVSVFAIAFLYRDNQFSTMAGYHVGFMFCFILGAFILMARAEVYDKERFRLALLANMDDEYARKALWMVTRSSDARAWRNAAVAQGRSLRYFDLQEMASRYQAQCGAEEPVFHHETINVLHQHQQLPT